MAQMTDDDDDAWGAQIEDKAAPSSGVSKDVLRKARQLNPQLAAQGSTTELFSKMKGAQPGAPADSAARVQGGVIAKTDFAGAFYLAQTKYKEDRKRVQDEIAKLQKQLAETAPKTLERIVDLVIEVDPNMTSPQTQEILKTETPFLNEIGFTVRKVIDKKMKRR